MAKGKCVKTKTLEGLGVINLEHPEKYRPWIRNRDLTSGSGRRYIIPCRFSSGRMIHLMSGLEKRAYDMLCQNRNIIGIYEQVALDIEDTIQICADMGFMHPRIPGRNQLSIMTTDLVVCIECGNTKKLVAYAVKPSSELTKERTIEKLKIEQEYWKRKNIQWEIITEQHF